MKNGSDIYYMNDSYWMVSSNANTLSLTSDSSFWAVYPLLEMPLSTIKSILGEKFPYERLLKSAINEGSEYWLKLALNWLEYMPGNELNPFVLALGNILKDKRYPQECRHISGRLIKKSNLNECNGS